MKTAEQAGSEQLLYNRVQAAHLLGCSVSTIKRLERLGKLKSRPLTDGDSSARYYRRKDLVTLAGGDK